MPRRRGPLRGVGTALAVGALVLVAALAASSSPAFAKRAFLHWQNWDPYDHPTKPVDISYIWDSSYDGLTFPRKPTTVLRIEAGAAPQYWRVTVLNAVNGGRWLEDDPALQGSSPPCWARTGSSRRGRKTDHDGCPRRSTVVGLRDHHLVGASTPVHFGSGDRPGRLRPDAESPRLDPLRRGDSYHVQSYSPSPTPAQFARSKPVYPARSTLASASTARSSRVSTRSCSAHLTRRAAPPTCSEPLTRRNCGPTCRCAALAEQVAGGAKSPYAAAVALEAYFRVGGGFIYDQHPPRCPRRAAAGGLRHHGRSAATASTSRARWR